MWISDITNHRNRPSLAYPPLPAYFSACRRQWRILEVRGVWDRGLMEPQYQHAAMAEDGEGRPGGGGAGSSDRLGRRTYTSSAYVSSLLDGLLALRQAGILHDVVLLVEGRPIQAHRVLLAASCDYFRWRSNRPPCCFTFTFSLYLLSGLSVSQNLPGFIPCLHTIDTLILTWERRCRHAFGIISVHFLAAKRLVVLES